MTTDRVGVRSLRPVDAAALDRARRRLEAASQAPWLHEEVARRMAARLPIFRVAPRRVVDWWPQAGASAAALELALPGARIDRIGSTPSARRHSRWSRWFPGRAPRQTVTDGRAASGYDLVWANMLLHHVPDPAELVAQWLDALELGGVLMFSTLGPGSLPGLRECYRQRGWGPPMADLVDMHDLGDMLVEAGFADPVMDQEQLRLSWACTGDALAELRTLGSNAAPQRHAGWRTPRWREHLLEAMAQSPTGRPAGRVELEFEIVYGHAFRPEPRHRVAPEAHIGVDELRRTLRRSSG